MAAEATPARSRVLVIEDDDAVRLVLRMLLEDEGMEVVEAASGGAAIEAFRRQPADLVLLDLRLPGVHGFEVCRQLRRTSGVPIIMVTAQQDSHDVVAGLECGADDYVTKQFNDRELLARIRAQLRRYPATLSRRDSMLFGDVEIRPSEGLVLKAGEPIGLTKTEFHLLVHLAEVPNRVWSRDQLLEHVWDYAYAGDGRLVDTHIRRLRIKVESDPQNPMLIQTVRGLGYKLVA
ncbi:MAG: response regulator transcription factor [Ilumatobacteraceae bacterium]